MVPICCKESRKQQRCVALRDHRAVKKKKIKEVTSSVAASKMSSLSTWTHQKVCDQAGTRAHMRSGKM